MRAAAALFEMNSVITTVAGTIPSSAQLLRKAEAAAEGAIVSRVGARLG
jgi:hypothetical protein